MTFVYLMLAASVTLFCIYSGSDTPSLLYFDYNILFVIYVSLFQWHALKLAITRTSSNLNLLSFHILSINPVGNRLPTKTVTRQSVENNVACK